MPLEKGEWRCTTAKPAMKWMRFAYSHPDCIAAAILLQWGEARAKEKAQSGRERR